MAHSVIGHGHTRARLVAAGKLLLPLALSLLAGCGGDDGAPGASKKPDSGVAGSGTLGSGGGNQDSSAGSGGGGGASGSGGAGASGSGGAGDGGPNRPPVADAGADLSGVVGVRLTVNGSRSSDPDGDILSYAWRVQSGPPGGTFSDAKLAVSEFQATSAGSYVVELTVTDPAGESATDSATLTVGEPAGRLSLGPSSIALRNYEVATVVLELPAAAPAGGAQVTLAAADPLVAEVPATVTVPAGQIQGFFNVAALKAGTTAISAGTGSMQSSLQVVVSEPLVWLDLDGAGVPLAVGETRTATVRLSSAAPTGGRVVTLAASSPARATLSATSVTVAEGQTSGTFSLTGTASGTQTIRASVSSPAADVATVRVSVAVVTDATKSSEALIETARVAGTLSAEQALVYRVYAAYGSNELPSAYRGRPSGDLDSLALSEARIRLDKLSAQNRAKLVPYLFPPTYDGSFGAVPGLVSYIGDGDGAGDTLAAESPCSAPYPGVNAVPFAVDWAHYDTPSFRVWYQTNVTGGLLEYYSAEQASEAARNIAAAVEPTFAKLKAALGPAPLSDAMETCNGGAPTYDIYVIGRGLSAKAQVLPYPPTSCARPGWMWFAPAEALNPKDTRDILAHELVHFFQLNLTRPGCQSPDPNADWRYNILDEAIATWGIDFVYPNDNYEHRYAVGDGRSPGYFTGPYGNMSGEWRASLLFPNVPVPAGGKNGYADYPFFEWLSRKYGSATVRSIQEATELANAQQAFEFGLSGQGGGLKALWPQFALAAWNDSKEHVADEFYRWESIGSPSLPQSGSVKIGALVPERLTIEATLNGQPFRDLGSKFSEIWSKTVLYGTPGQLYAMTASYVDIKFTDSTVSYVVFENDQTLVAQYFPRLKIQALQKIDGSWKGVEDWTAKETAEYCRDRRSERIEELVLIYSNSDPGDLPFDGVNPAPSKGIIDLGTAPRFQITNVGCYRWTGTSSVRRTDDWGGSNDVNATVTFDRIPDMTPGALAFNAVSGNVQLRGTSNAPNCTGTYSGAGSGGSIPDSQPSDDGVLTFQAFATPNVIGTGATEIPGMIVTLDCPPSQPIVQNVQGPIEWLRMPPQGATLSADGKQLSGTYTLPTGQQGTLTARWDLRAQTE